MSVEFVLPESPPDDGPTPGASGRSLPSRSAGRWLAAVWAAAAVLLATAVTQDLYTLRETVYYDFDGTTARSIDVHIDAFGDARDASTTASAISTQFGRVVGYGTAWAVVAGLLLAAAGWALIRPRSSRPTVVATALGGMLLGAVLTVGLGLRADSGPRSASVGLVELPDSGFWLVLAAGALSTLTGLAVLMRPARRPPRPAWTRRRTPAGFELE